MLLLLSCCIIAGMAAEDPPVTHYRLKNSSVCLHVRKSLKGQEVTWEMINVGMIINTKGDINPNYTEKVDYNRGNFSLCIKKLTETDSGTYEATVTQGFTKSREQHRLIVQEAVPRPVIRMAVLNSNQSDGSCNLTVNCSTQDGWAWSVCDEARCRTSQRSLGAVNITISTDNRTIVCKANNHVSTSNVSESVGGICLSETNTEYTGTSLPAGIIIAIISGTFFICVLAVFLAKRFYFSRECHNQQVQTALQIARLSVEVQPQPAGDESSSCQTETVYENVDDTQHIQASNTTITPEGARSKQPPKVDTVYCSLQLPVTTAPLDKRDNREHQNQSRDNMRAGERPKQPSELATVQPVQTYPQNLRSASSEETDDGDVLVKDVQRHQEARGNSVTLEEAQHPVQPDTLYSVLQKPRHLPRSKHQQQAKQDCGGQTANNDT
ncbi:signaling lymphocytic activation molecule-like [Centroberyx affinis]|uniref:signaling lymphocytic activation molecule-like n=1 Tax=Centroberyx affinis TaxID=166261 RepID=UPI003A5B986E